MLDVLLDAILDTLKLIPFLFIAFLMLEYIEHKMNKKSQKALVKRKRLGPLFGSILGAFPQCGFSGMATNLFSERVITLGTLIAIYLSTSDEMLPIMISNKIDWILIIKLILSKVIIGLIVGFIIDFITYKKYNKDNFQDEIHHMCDDHDCHCEDGIIKSSIIHTLSISVFILIFNIILGLLFYYIGEDNIKLFIANAHGYSYFLSSLIGLIPNCASSVIITELYVSNLISVGEMLSGLLTGSGIGILLLFKTNKNLKENLTILGIIYFIGVILGYLIDLIGVIF